MQLKEQFNPSGELSITAEYLDGSKLLLLKKKNLVVDSAKLAILSTLSSSINRLRVGTGGTVDPDGLFIKPVVGSLTSLYTQVETSPGVPFEKVLTPSLNSAQFTLTLLADLDFGDLNGTLLTEAALYQGAFGSGTPTMFSIKVHPGIRKTSNFALHYEWVIKI